MSYVGQGRLAAANGGEHYADPRIQGTATVVPLNDLLPFSSAHTEPQNQSPESYDLIMVSILEDNNVQIQSEKWKVVFNQICSCYIVASRDPSA